MATTSKQPGDAANLFVRVLLGDAGTVAGGLTGKEWKKTLDWFDGRCAYTNKRLDDDVIVKDHAIPINQSHCGLHLYGNVVPTTGAANQRKGGKHYREFLHDKPKMLKRLEDFIEQSGYWERTETFGDLSGYCQTQYEVIKSLCEANRGYLQSLAGTEMEPPERDTRAPLRPGKGRLQIDFDPRGPNRAFKKELLSTKRALITTYYEDGSEETSIWRADNVTPKSNVVGNVRSRPQFRRGQWQQRGITKVRVSIDRIGK